MANGASALRLVESAPVPQVPSEPIEQRIGTATAFAVAALCKGAVEYWQGGLTEGTRSLGGEAVARLYTLAQSAPHLDLTVVAHREGMRILRAQHAAGPTPTMEFPEALAIETIDGLLGILGKVVAHMRLVAN